MNRSSLIARMSGVQGLNPTITVSIVAGLAAICWIPHLPDSLWLDETITSWVIKDSLLDSFDRGVHFQSQSAYYALMWVWTRLVGSSEIALRLPSLLATFASCFALASVGRRLTQDRETGLLAVVVFAASASAFRESVDARAYMPSFLVLLVIVISLIRWLDEGRWRDVWICGVLAALLPHFHLFFALSYPAFALYAGLRWPRGRPHVLPQLGVFFLLLGLGALLFLPAWLTLVTHGNSYSFAARPDWSAFIGKFAWPGPVAGLLTGLCLAGILSRGPAGEADGESRPRALPGDASWLLTAWIFVPLLTLYVFSTNTDMSVFITRHLMGAIPAVCLVYAIALRGIPSGPARIAAAVVIAAASISLNGRPPDDFRDAARAVNQFVSGDRSVPVFLGTGLIELEDEAIFRAPDFQDYLLAPTSYYPIDGRVIIVPRKLRGQPLARELVDPILARQRPFVAVEWYRNGSRILPWLTNRAEAAGYVAERQGFGWGSVRVVFFRPGR